MAKNAAISVRLPLEIKKSLASRARAQRRSLSAQIAHDLETAARSEPGPSRGGRILGRFPADTDLSDEDVAAVRSALWGRLARTARRG